MEESLQLEKAIYNRKIKRNALIVVALIILLFVAVLVAISVGTKSVNIKTVMGVLFENVFPNEEITNVQRQIVINIRIPRVVAAVLAGMLLSNAGLLMQCILQNPLASPYTLGVSNGAALGASIAIVFSSILGAAAYSPYIIPIFAFAFATITMLLVFGISKISRNATWTLLLGGVAIGYLMSSLTSLIKYMADTVKLPELVFWSLGSLTGLPWEAIFIMLGMAVISNVFMLYYALDLNAMPLGEETAVSLGINYKKMRQLSFIFATLMTAVSVAFTGVIGFVGLVAPHLSRMIIGNDFRLQVWTSGIIGGLLLLISDTVARTIIAPTELPVGIITSVLGVPFFLFLIVKRGRE